MAMALYRGKLHRVPDAPREWTMPPRAITLDQFRTLTQRRSRALARLAAQSKPNSNSDQINEEVLEKEVTGKDEEMTESGGANSEAARAIEVEEVAKKAVEDGEMVDVSEEEKKDTKGKKAEEVGAADAKMEVNNNSGAVSDREKKRMELERKLEAMKQKKHNLVQMLKQILNAEEEIKRRNAQAAAARSSIPLQAETVDMASSTRIVPKLSVEVNFGGDFGAESDSAANQSAHGRQMHPMNSTSPSALSVTTRPFQQTTILPIPRSNFAYPGHSQSPSNALVGSGAVTASPSRFAPAGHQTHHHHSSSLPPFSAPGSHFMASSPSPAASGGASSVFRDPHLSSSS